MNDLVKVVTFLLFEINQQSHKMEPDELEFIGENATIGVIPNFNHDPIYLISGAVGPFRGGQPLHIPLWLAMHLRQQQKCRIVPPVWMDVTLLENLKEEEKRSR